MPGAGGKGRPLQFETALPSGAFFAGGFPVGVGAGHGDADRRDRAAQELLDGDDLEAGDRAPVGVPEPDARGLGGRCFRVPADSL